MRSRMVACLVVVWIGVLGIPSGCSRSSAPADTTAAPGSQVVSQIGLGQLSGHIYTHDHFKLAVTIPDEWYIQNKSEADQLAQAGTAVMKKDAHGQAVAQAAQQRTLTLLSAFQHPPGTPVEFNPSFIVLAENVSFLPGLKLGEDYLKLMGKSMSALTLKHELEPIETGFKIGSHPAARLRIHLHVADKLVEQESYAARVGDYFLVVMLSYGEEEQRDVLRSILAALKAD